MAERSQAASIRCLSQLPGIDIVVALRTSGIIEEESLLGINYINRDQKRYANLLHKEVNYYYYYLLLERCILKVVMRSLKHWR